MRAPAWQLEVDTRELHGFAQQPSNRGAVVVPPELLHAKLSRPGLQQTHALGRFHGHANINLGVARRPVLVQKRF